MDQRAAQGGWTRRIGFETGVDTPEAFFEAVSGQELRTVPDEQPNPEPEGPSPQFSRQP